MHNFSFVQSKYRQGRLCGASAFSLLMITYNEAILGCNARDAGHAIAAINVLQENLERDPSSELVTYLANAYDISIKLIKKNNFDLASTLLQAVRESWREAYQQIDKQRRLQKPE